MVFNKAFQQYAKSLKASRYDPLDSVTEKILVKKYREGDVRAFEKIVNAYLRFVIHIIKEFKIPNDIDIMDVIQEGNEGFMVGLSKFNPDGYDCRVSTYCVYWIKFYIKKMLSARVRHSSIFYSLPEDEDISQVLAEEDVIEVNLKKKIHEDINVFVLNKLEDRERYIIKAYFGMEYPYTQKTLQEIASICHINCERVRQIRNGAIDKLNKQVISKIVHTL